MVATTHLGITHAARGDFSDAASILGRNAALGEALRYERFGTPNIPLAVSDVFLADVLSQLGRFTRQSDTRRPPCRLAKQPIILTRCTSG